MNVYEELLEKAKYTKRWRNAKGEWEYQYGAPSKVSKKANTVGKTTSGEAIYREAKSNKHYSGWSVEDHREAAVFFSGKQSPEGHGRNMEEFHMRMMEVADRTEAGLSTFDAQRDADKQRRFAQKKVREYKQEQAQAMEKGHKAMGLPNHHQEGGDGGQEKVLETQMHPVIQDFHAVDMDVSSEDDEPEDSIGRKTDMVARESADKYKDYWTTQKSLDALAGYARKLKVLEKGNSDSVKDAHGIGNDDAVASTDMEKAMDKEQNDLATLSGLSALEQYSKSMPSGDTTTLKKPKSNAIGGSADGGSLEGGTHGASEAADLSSKQGMNPSKPSSDKLSEDDAEEEKQMKEHKKPMERMVRSFGPADQRDLTAREHAVRVSQLQKSQDVRVLSADEQAEALLKSQSDDFYVGGSPMFDKPEVPAESTRLCKSGHTMSAILTACPQCSDGQITHRVAPGVAHIGTAGVEQPHTPVLRKARVEPDVRIGEPTIVRMVNSNGAIRKG